MDITLVPANQGDTSDADYSLSATSLTFSPADTSKSFTFTATDDSDNDDGETVKLTFVNLPAGVSVGTPAETTVSITDDDVPSVEVSFQQNSYNVAEGSGVTVKVKLSAEPEREVIIPITKANQDGASGDDYSGVPANVTFNSGDTEVDISFAAASDNVDDDGESVKLTFGNTLPTGVTKGTPAETIVSITDDDVPSVEVSFQQNSYNVAEGSGVTVKVKLNAEPEREVIIPSPRPIRTGPPATTTPAFRLTSPSTAAIQRWTSASPPPRTTWTTTERASSSPSATPSRPVSPRGPPPRPSSPSPMTMPLRP